MVSGAETMAFEKAKSMVFCTTVAMLEMEGAAGWSAIATVGSTPNYVLQDAVGEFNV